MRLGWCGSGCDLFALGALGFGDRLGCALGIAKGWGTTAGTPRPGTDASPPTPRWGL
jgi:hypothetical protein